MSPRGTRTRVLTHERFARPPVPDPAQRELSAIRDILHAHLNADRPEETFQFALDRLGPLIGSSFASVYLVDGVSEVMRLAAASNWPAKYRPWLGEMRVRVGFGPSGEAVTERRTIEIPDVMADQGLEDWVDVAQELGFRSLVALPLLEAGGALGTVTFYFAEPGSARAEQRQLMALVADLLATTAAKIRMADALRRAESALNDTSADLDAQYAETLRMRSGRESFLDYAADDLKAPLEEILAPLQNAARTDPAMGDAARAAAELRWRLDDLLEFAALRGGIGASKLETLDPLAPLDQAERLLAEHGVPGEFLRDTPPGLPSVLGDRNRLTRLLASLVKVAQRTAAPDADVTVSVGPSQSGRQLEYRVAVASGLSVRDADAALGGEYRGLSESSTTGLGLARARLLAESMGGSVQAESEGSRLAFVALIPLAH